MARYGHTGIATQVRGLSFSAKMPLCLDCILPPIRVNDDSVVVRTKAGGLLACSLSCKPRLWCVACCVGAALALGAWQAEGRAAVKCPFSVRNIPF